ncbi:MAG: hypothetical protein HOJ22_08280 [Chloroflexi bacterium]|nr:hypothetical protein [Chloroflexota bacterium]MBT5628274.1 hypothetical protein [Chloroflexota bacterium]
MIATVRIQVFDAHSTAVIAVFFRQNPDHHHWWHEIVSTRTVDIAWLDDLSR